MSHQTPEVDFRIPLSGLGAGCGSCVDVGFDSVDSHGVWDSSDHPRAQTPFGHAIAGATPLRAEGVSAGRMLCRPPADTPAVRSKTSLPSACPNGVWARGRQ